MNINSKQITREECKQKTEWSNNRNKDYNYNNNNKHLGILYKIILDNLLMS